MQASIVDLKLVSGKARHFVPISDISFTHDRVSK